MPACACRRSIRASSSRVNHGCDLRGLRLSVSTGAPSGPGRRWRAPPLRRMHRHGGVRAFWPRMRAGRGASALGGRGRDAMRTDDLQLRRALALRTVTGGLLRLRWLAAATRFEFAMLRHLRALKSGYNPDQPRVRAAIRTAVSGRRRTPTAIPLRSGACVWPATSRPTIRPRCQRSDRRHPANGSDG